MGHEMKLAKVFSHAKLQRLGLVVLVGFILVFMAILALPKPSLLPSPSWSLRLPVHPSSTSIIAHEKNSFQKLDATDQNGTQGMKPICDFSDRRSDICEIIGDIRVQGNSSSIIFISSQLSTAERLESWRIKPHSRKGDTSVMSRVSEMTIKSLTSPKNAPACTHNHNITAIIFSTGGYMGNMFHDFTDVLIPLFLTSHQFNGEVQLLISEMNPRWIAKYQPFFKQLSHYNIIDFNNDNRVHCFPHAIVGLKSHKEMSIDPSRAPNGYSMADFTRLIRSSFSLERESVINLGIKADKRPRLLIIARKWTRSFTNVGEIAQLAMELGYEPLVAEPQRGSNLTEFAHIVNSCDVMMGVHGAGLTNLVFLPMNATVVQIVPLGRLEMIAWADFGRPALDMKLRYLQYDISVEESTLIERYPREHPVFKDPLSIHQQGWMALRSIYLVKQNVKLDVERFKPVLLQALQLLHQ